MESKSREEADDSSGNKLGSDGKAVMFCDRRIGERVNASSRPHEEPLPVKPDQKLAGDSERLNITRTDKRLASRKAENPFGGWAGCHVSFYR